MDSYCEGPQRHPLEGLQLHQSRTQSPWKEIEAPCWQMEGKQEVATVRTICSHLQNMIKVLHWASITGWGRCMPTSPSMLLFRRMVLLWKSELFWVKNTYAGFEWGQGLPVQYLKPRKVSWFLKEMTLNLCQIQLLWFSKPPQLRISENFWMVSMFLKKEQFSRLMNKISVILLQKQQDSRWFYGLSYDPLKRQ